MRKKAKHILEGQVLYLCEDCGRVAWGDTTAYLLCGYCHQNGQTAPMKSYWDEEFKYWTTAELALLALVHGG